MAYFPLFVNLEGKHVLVIGGGKIAERRVKALLEFGCNISVIAPDVSEEIHALAECGRVNWIPEEYRGQWILQNGALGAAEECIGEKDKTKKDEASLRPVFVLAAAVEAVNIQVAMHCKKAGIPVNDASKKERCDFYFPGLAKEGDVVVGVTTGGSDHKLAAALSANIRELIKK